MSQENVNVWLDGWEREGFPERELLLPTEELTLKWKNQQKTYAQSLVLLDDFSWTLIPRQPNTLRYIAGADISFVKASKIDAVATFTVCEYPSMNLVWETYQMIKLTAPYIAGLLAFREVPFFLDMLEKLRQDNNPYYPQLIMIDGNGLLHMRSLGQACHLGLLADIPCFGVAKKLLVTDGINETSVEESFKAAAWTSDPDSALLVGRSGVERAYAHKWRQSPSLSYELLYISAGHRISLETSLKITKLTNRGNSLPEPVYLADHLSREFLHLNNMK